MDRQIGVGDLVVVVQPSACIGGVDGIGHTFVVEDMHMAMSTLCHYCRREHHSAGGAYDGKYWWGLSRLKRIPPLEELEGEKREVKEPA